MRRLLSLLALLALPCGAGPLILATATNNVSMSGACIGASPCAATVLTDSALNQWTVVSGVVYLAPGGANNAATISGSVILCLYYKGVIYQENSNLNWWYWNGAWIATTDPRATVPTGTVGVAISANTFVNTSNNTPVVIAGTNISGMEGHQGSWTILAQVTTAQWAALAAKWGINMIRLPLNSAYWLNHTVYDDPAEPGGGSCCYTSIGGGAYTPDPTGTYQAALQTIVTNITAAGLVVDLDLHWDAPKNNAGFAIAPIGQPSYAGGDYAALFWTQVATAFKNNPLVTFELFNEPFGSNVYSNWVTGVATPGPDAITMVNGGTFANFKMQDNAASNAIFTLQGCNPCNVAGMKSLITTIRATGATNVILGSPIGYAGELETWLASYTGSGNPDPSGQFGAAWHVYGYSKGVGYPNAVLAANYPIAITETYGFDNVFDGGKSTNGYTWAATNYVPVDVWAWATWSSGGAGSGTALYNYWLGSAPWVLGPATAPTGNTFGAAPLVSAVPTPAAAVGYNTLTFNSTTINATNGPWYPWAFYDESTPSNEYTQNGDGSITLTYNSNSGATLATAKPAPGQYGFTGWVPGGGMYWEVTATIQTPTAHVPGGPAAFWLLDIEHTSQGSAYSVGWPSNPQLQNADGTGAMDDYIEWDSMEFDNAAQPGVKVGYNSNGSNWTNHVAGTALNWGESNIWHQQFGGSSGSTPLPPNTDLTQKHKYGWLWVPATGSLQTTTTQGYVAIFFDGVQIAGGTVTANKANPTDGFVRPAYWNYHDPTDIAHYPTPTAAGAPTSYNESSPPVVYGDVCNSIMDFRHMMPIIGGGIAQSVTVYASQVWQKSAANNLSH